jgi:hypothetical protein
MTQDGPAKCPQCGGDVFVDDDGRRAPVTTAPDPCVCQEYEVPPHWRR